MSEVDFQPVGRTPTPRHIQAWPDINGSFLTCTLYSGLFCFVANQICDEYVLLSEPRRSVQAVCDDPTDIPLCDAGINEGTSKLLQYVCTFN